MRALHVAALAASLTACGARLAAPPPVFPLKNAWTATLGGLLEGELASDGQAVYVGTRDGRVRAVDPDKGSNNTETVFNVIAGAGLNAIPLKPFGQFKYVIKDGDDPLQFAVGVRF